MPLLSEIDISDYQKTIKEKVSLILDPVFKEIPLDPVFVNYLNTKKQVIRLISRNTLQELQQRNDISRKILEELKEDQSGIRIALKYAENLSESETRYRAFLLKMSNLTGEGILNVLRKLNQMVQIINLSLVGKPFLLKIHRLLHKDVEVYLNEFMTMAACEGGAEKTITGLTDFYKSMYLQQTEITAIKHSQLTSEGKFLTVDQIVCPVTRTKILVSNSLRTGNKANNFLAIFIALSKLAKLKDVDIENFLTSQSSDYLELANKKLLQYLRYPIWFNFSAEQQQFLEEVGAKSVAKQLTYKHLWDEKKTLLENVLSLLLDYNKQDWRYPVFGLFITGHWNRHHHAEVTEAIKALQDGKEISVTLNQLKNNTRLHPQYNGDGSLANRLQFIQCKLSQIPVVQNAAPALGIAF